jgi:hypothetical protein
MRVDEVVAELLSQTAVCAILQAIIYLITNSYQCNCANMKRFDQPVLSFRCLTRCPAVHLRDVGVCGGLCDSAGGSLVIAGSQQASQAGASNRPDAHHNLGCQGLGCKP